jgi:hypothetical protein
VYTVGRGQVAKHGRTPYRTAQVRCSWVNRMVKPNKNTRKGERGQKSRYIRGRVKLDCGRMGKGHPPKKKNLSPRQEGSGGRNGANGAGRVNLTLFGKEIKKKKKPKGKIKMEKGKGKKELHYYNITKCSRLSHANQRREALQASQAREI